MLFSFFLCLVLKCEEQVASCQKELHEFRLTSCRKVYNCVVALILPTMYVPVVASIFSLNTIGIYVVVNFLSQVIFVFLLFLGMVMYANEIETKEK